MTTKVKLLTRKTELRELRITLDFYANLGIQEYASPHVFLGWLTKTIMIALKPPHRKRWIKFFLHPSIEQR